MTDSELGKLAYELDRAHVFHSWSAQATLKPFTVASASGSYMYDYEGNAYLDFSSQLVNTNIGHSHPKVVAAIQAQAAELATVAPQHAVLVRGQAAKLIADLAPAGFNKVFFTNGGADANENAIRMARLHTGKLKVLSHYRSYHGNTGAAINATGDWRRLPNEHSAGHVHFFGPFPYRSTFWSQNEVEESQRALEHLEQVIQYEGPQTIAAILLETIPGTAGVLMPPPGYLAGVAELCRKYGIIYIADEVMCGFGRAGSWFAFNQFDAMPDLITFAKGSNSGYVPLGGVIISDEIAKTFDERVFPGGLTYSGHPLACASAVAAITAMQEEGIVENAARIGREVLGPGLTDLMQKHPIIGQVRGTGVFWALDLVHNRATKKPVAPMAGAAPIIAEAVGECRKRGLLPFTAGNRIHVTPACNISDDDAHKGLRILDEVLTLLDRHVED